MSGAQSLRAALEANPTVSMVKPDAKRASSSRKSSKAGPQKSLSAMQRLDAADGKMDGKYFGAPIHGGGHGRDHSTSGDHGPSHGHSFLDGDDNEIRMCDLKDPEDHESSCMHSCVGGLAMQRHQAACPFAPVVCPNDKCGQTVSNRGYFAHLETCKYQKLQCFLCHARYYRMDADYHHSICHGKKIKCPLSCGLIMPRGDLHHHLESDYMKHSAEILESQDYLPADHPSRVYGQLLRRLKDLRVQVELARKPGLLRGDEAQLSPIYLPSKAQPTRFDSRAHSSVSFIDESEWLRRYNQVMDALQDLRTEITKAHHMVHSQEHRLAEQVLSALESDRGSVNQAAYDAIAEMEEVLDIHEGEPGSKVVTVDDTQMTLDELFDRMEAMKALLAEEENDFLNYKNAVRLPATGPSFEFDGFEDVEEA